MNSIKVRRPFAPVDTMAYRIANIIASTNEDDFLTDVTGNRRYLCFNVHSINENEYIKIKIDDVWAEAYQLFKSSFIYYTTPAEIIELATLNKEYSFISSEEQYIYQFFRKASSNDDEYHLLQANTICDFLSLYTGNKNISSIRIGRALQKLGYEKVSYCFSWAAESTKSWRIKVLKNAEAAILASFICNNNNSFKP